MSSEKKWLVKSSDSIQGPLEFDVVVENIFTGDIHLLDEIKGPFERWRPIKDHSLFAAAIEKLKASTYQVRENTMTATIDINTKTNELTRTETVTQKTSSTMTPAEETITPTEEVGEGTVIYQPVLNQEGQPQQAGLPNQTVLSQNKRNQRFPTVFLFTFVLIVFGVAGAYLFLQFSQSRMIEQKISLYDQLTDVAFESLRVGEHETALKNFTQAYKISPTDPNLIVEMAPLSVQIELKLEQTKQQLEQIIATNKNKSILKKAHNSIGLAYSRRERFDQAINSYDQALSYDPSYLPSQLNKAFAFLKLQKYDEAVSLMREVVAENRDEPIAHYMYIRALTDKGIATSSDFSLKETLSVSGNYATEYFDFRQEVMFLIAMVNQKLNAPPEKMQQLVNNIMRIDLELTNLHVHDAQIDKQAFNWVDYFHYCQVLGESLPDYSQKLFKGFCHLKVGRPQEAKGVFEDLMAQKTNDGILQALYASALFKIGEISEAKNALGFINKIDLKQPVVETILRGCLSAGELSCGEALFKGQHSKHISPLYLRWGESEVNIAKDRQKAKRSVSLGLQNSPRFAPLLKLSRKFN